MPTRAAPHVVAPRPKDRHPWGPMRTGVVLAALFAGWCAPPATAQEASPHRPIDVRYEGKYRDDPWFTDVPERFRAAAEEGFERACAGLGLDRATLDTSVFRVFLSDARGISSTWVKHTRPWMECFGYPGDRGGIQLRITTESLRNGFAADLPQGITHELTHALMRATCPGYRTVPNWIREGMAVYIAGQGPTRLRMHLMRPTVANAPHTLLNGLEEFGGKHTLDDYTEDYLAMVYLENAAGPGAVKRLHGGLQANRPWRTALREVSGRSWPDFQTGALAFAKAELDKADDAEHKAFATVATLRMGRQYDATLPAADTFLAAYPASIYAKMAHYHRARAHYALKQYDKAIADFAAAAQIGTPFSAYDDDLLFWWGWCLYKTKRYADAAPKFEAVLRDHVSYADPAAAAYFWGLALGNAGRADESRAVLAKAMRAFPSPKESWMMPAAKQMLADLDAGTAGRAK